MSAASRWDRHYARRRQARTDPDADLVRFAADLEPRQAVDLGAGEGRNSLWLARHGWDVTAVDLSAVALDHLRSAAAQALPVSTVHADLRSYLAGRPSFDLVVLANLHPPAAERRDLLSAAAGAVAPGGHLFFVGVHLESLGRAGPPDPDQLYTEGRLEGMLLGLDVLRMYRRLRPEAAGLGPTVSLVVWAAAPAWPVQPEQPEQPAEPVHEG